MRVTHSGDPVWTEALMAGAASERAIAIAAAGLSGAVCLPIRTGEDCLGAIEFYCRELEEPDEQLRELLRHDRPADRPLHPAHQDRARARRARATRRSRRPP